MTIFEHYYFCIAIWLSQLFPNVLITVIHLDVLLMNWFVIFPLFSTVIVITVSPLSCVSCVPASCVLIWFVSCPRFLWWLVHSCPAVFVSLSMIILCIYSPVCSVWFGLFNSLHHGVPVCVSLELCDLDQYKDKTSPSRQNIQWETRRHVPSFSFDTQAYLCVVGLDIC